MGLTTDRNDPRLGYGMNEEPVPQNEAYLILSEEERAKGFVRPLRRSYVHQYMLDGSKVPYPLVSMKGVGGCGALTTMALPLAETYARDPKFYGATYCVGCKMHRPVEEFIWDGTDEPVGS
jgi:hypothetical protein